MDFNFTLFFVLFYIRACCGTDSRENDNQNQANFIDRKQKLFIYPNIWQNSYEIHSAGHVLIPFLQERFA